MGTTQEKKLCDIMKDRMSVEGWDTIRRFTEGSKVPFSLETTRRIFNEKEYESVAPTTIAIVARYLGFKPNEIRDLLKKYTDDKDLWPMLGDSEGRITEDEQAIVDCYKKITEAKSGIGEVLVRQLEFVAMIAGVDITAEVHRLKRG